MQGIRFELVLKMDDHTVLFFVIIFIENLFNIERLDLGRQIRLRNSRLVAEYLVEMISFHVRLGETELQTANLNVSIVLKQEIEREQLFVIEFSPSSLRRVLIFDGQDWSFEEVPVDLVLIVDVYYPNFISAIEEADVRE